MTLNLKPTKELVQRSDRVKVSVFFSYNLFELISSTFVTRSSPLLLLTLTVPPSFLTYRALTCTLQNHGAFVVCIVERL